MKPGREKGVWYVLEAGPYNQALVGLSRDEIADWAISLGRALARQERGINTFADDLMDERERYLETRRETGKMGGRPPKKGHPGVTLGSPHGNGGAVPNRTETVPNPTEPHRTETEPDIKPEPKPKEPEPPRDGRVGVHIGEVLGAGNGDKYETIANLTHDELPDYAARFCQEADPNRAISAYKRMIGLVGPEAFRREMSSFAGEVTSGEEPESRGAAFMARLKRLVSGKANQRPLPSHRRSATYLESPPGKYSIEKCGF